MTGSVGAVRIYERNGGVWVETFSHQHPSLPGGTRMGQSVDASADVVVAGAPSVVTTSAGHAFVYERDSSGFWLSPTELTPSDGAPGDQFGMDVSVSAGGDIVAVGAPSHDLSFGDEGAVYIFEKLGSNWVETAKLTDPSPGKQDRFGTALELDGGRLAVGNPGWQSGGAVVMFSNGPSGWAVEQVIGAPGVNIAVSFGQSLDLSADVLVVGDHLSKDPWVHRGAAHVYRLCSTGWTEEAKLQNPIPGTAGFGLTVAVDAGRLVVGAHTFTAPGPESRAGAAYVFTEVRDPLAGNSWVETDLLLEPAPLFERHFGDSVSVSGETVMVGVPDRPSGFGTSGGTGSAYFYTCNDTHACVVELSQTPGPPTDGFGYSVDVGNGTLAVGAITSSPSGAAMAYGWDGSTTTPQGVVGIPGSSGQQGFAVSADGARMAVGDPVNDIVHIYERNAGVWTLEGAVGPLQLGSNFGWSLALDGDRLAVGAPMTDGLLTNAQGRVYVYEHSGTAWNSTAIIENALPSANALFGAALALDGDRIAVGAPGTGLFQPGGSLQVFVELSGAWTPEHVGYGLVGWVLGSDLALDGDTLLVGSPEIPGLGQTGRAMLYTNPGSGWQLETTLVGDDAMSGDLFGLRVDLSGSRAVVSSQKPLDAPLGGWHGAAYVFDGTCDGDWLQTARLDHPGPGPAHPVQPFWFYSGFAWDVAVAEDWTVMVSHRFGNDGNVYAGAVHLCGP